MLQIRYQSRQAFALLIVTSLLVLGTISGLTMANSYVQDIPLTGFPQIKQNHQFQNIEQVLYDAQSNHIVALTTARDTSGEPFQGFGVAWLTLDGQLRHQITILPKKHKQYYRPQSFVRAKDGSIYALASSTLREKNNSSRIAILVVKIDRMRNIVWEHEYLVGETYHLMNKIVSSIDNGIVLCGKITDSATTTLNILVMEIESSGMLRWKSDFPSVTNDNCNDIINDGEQGYLVAASQNGHFKLFSLNKNGKKTWEKEISKPGHLGSASNIFREKNGQLRVLGSFLETVDRKTRHFHSFLYQFSAHGDVLKELRLNTSNLDYFRNIFFSDSGTSIIGQTNTGKNANVWFMHLNAEGRGIPMGERYLMTHRELSGSYLLPNGDMLFFGTLQDEIPWLAISRKSQLIELSKQPLQLATLTDIEKYCQWQIQISDRLNKTSTNRSLTASGSDLFELQHEATNTHITCVTPGWVDVESSDSKIVDAKKLSYLCTVNELKSGVMHYTFKLEAQQQVLRDNTIKTVPADMIVQDYSRNKPVFNLTLGCKH